MGSSVGIQVVDGLGASQDPSLPFLSRALDADEVQRRIVPLVRRGTHGDVELREIRVARHKAGRRCLVEYRFELQRGAARPEAMTVFGKARARGTDVRTHGLVESLWQAGFRSDHQVATAVPQPFGVVPEFHMWLQRGVPGVLATDLTDRPEGAAVMRRIAEGIHALHTAGVPPRRQHTIADELRILHERLPRVVEARPAWRARIERLLRGCEQLAERIDEPRPRGIHRDFYADQLVVDGDRLYLLDLDLYALGDPALDVGNFVAHLTEQGLRVFGDPEAYLDLEEAFQERYLELSDDASRASVQAYATLTLVRHVQISTMFRGRRHTTAPLLDLCERRLGVAAHPEHLP